MAVHLKSLFYNGPLLARFGSVSHHSFCIKNSKQAIADLSVQRTLTHAILIIKKKIAAALGIPCKLSRVNKWAKWSFAIVI